MTDENTMTVEKLLVEIFNYIPDEIFLDKEKMVAVAKYITDDGGENICTVDVSSRDGKDFDTIKSLLDIFYPRSFINDLFANRKIDV